MSAGRREPRQHGFQPAVLDDRYGQQFGMGVISSQPGVMGGVAGGGTAASLQYLAHVDQLLVQQKVELLEAFTGFETNNKYVVTNSMGQGLFYVVEDTDCCTRWCCGPIRPFDIRVMDSQQQEVLHLSRPLRGQGCCCPCCLQELEVTAGGQVIGLVKEEWSFIRPKLTVMRPDGSPVLRVGGPICQCALCSDVSFPVLSADRSQEVGQITKQWSGCVKEMCTDADNMGVSFPMDLETNMKATLLGALFLIEFMYFERQK